MEKNMSNENKKVKVHYEGTLNDGTKFDSSYDRGEPLEFVVGAGMMIKGFDDAVRDMKVGEVKNIHLMPEEAYGQPNPQNILTMEIARMPGYGTSCCRSCLPPTVRRSTPCSLSRP
ncbi:FKBP-type peptidyl-prolyl cis-trans isomerase [Acidaminococcus timonensis]|uniref:FKBP-type peptidyl-prolyl cis-trans isomerase n=2 Tax=Acidaminococcus timonensis TaxID=1871002 RepID=UPI003080AAAA